MNSIILVIEINVILSRSSGDIEMYKNKIKNSNIIWHNEFNNVE